MLCDWDRVHGHATEAKRHGGYCKRCVCSRLCLSRHTQHIHGFQASIPPPPPPVKIYSSEDTMALEDESGRIRLVGDRAKEAKLVTGVIAGVLGLETPNGDFEVIDICFPEMAPQPASEPTDEDTMDIDGERVFILFCLPLRTN